MLLKIIKWCWAIETHPIECRFTITEHGSHAQPKLDSTQENALPTRFQSTHFSTQDKHQ